MISILKTKIFLLSGQAYKKVGLPKPGYAEAFKQLAAVKVIRI